MREGGRPPSRVANDRKLRLHVRRLHHLAFDPYDTIRCTQKAFGPIGIRVDVCSIQSINVPLKDLERFARIQGPYLFNTTDADRFEMYSRYGVQDLASVDVFLLARITPILNRDGTRPSRAHPRVKISKVIDAVTGRKSWPTGPDSPAFSCDGTAPRHRRPGAQRCINSAVSIPQYAF